MYRILKVQCATLQNKYTTSLSANLQPSTKMCSFCRIYHLKIPKSTVSYLQRRHQATTINTAPLDLPVPKKFKRKTKRYAELLEVADNMTSTRKASIRHLNAAQLAILVDQPNVTLDKLHKIKSELNQVHNQKIKQHKDSKIVDDLQNIDVVDLSKSRTRSINDEIEDDVSIMEDLQALNIADHAGLIKNSSFLQTLQIHKHEDDMQEEAGENIIEEETQKIHEKPSNSGKAENEAPTQTKIELADKAKEESLARSLHAYLRVCLNCGMSGRAYHTLMYYRRKGIKYKVAAKVVDVELYNVLLRHYATSSNFTKIKNLLRIIKEDSLKPSPPTFAAVFEAVGRLPKPEDQRELLNTIRSEMEENGITFDDVVKIPKYFLDHRKYVMKAIRLLDLGFQPTVEVPDYSYDNLLLTKISFMESRVNPSPAENLLTVAQLQERFSAQLKNEINGDVVVKSIEKMDNLSNTATYCRQIISNLEESWSKIALNAFDRNLEALKNRERVPTTHSITLYPYLCVLEKEEYIEAIMREVRNLATGSDTYSPSLTALYHRFGTRLNAKYEIAAKQRSGVIENIEKVYFNYCDWYLNRKDGMNSRTAWQKITSELEKKGVSLEVENMDWPYSVHLGIGKFLYDIILKDFKLDINCIKPNSKEQRYLPAFYTLFRPKGKRSAEEIKPHPILTKLYRESHPGTLTFAASYVPSLCPPKPWNTVRSGGYLVAKCEIIRIPMNSKQQWQRLDSAPPKQLWPALDSLNQLASIPWAVNNPVLDIVIEVFRDGGSTKLNVPQPPSALPPVPPLQPDSNEAQRLSTVDMRMDLRRKKMEMYSLWCDLLYRLSLANHFRDSIFWLPHNMDFRGRVYPIPPHLNHLGSDLARSLLVFAQGKPLGRDGLDWLKLHTINLTGLKKRDSVNERLRYAEENMDKILDSAENPLTGNMWWATSEEPWQTLAACMEIAQALKAPDPAKYISRFPVHQDGSCNGLQHYAALGRDQIGAESVNLNAFERPQDVYSSVAAMVDRLREEDEANGVEVAKVLKGFVKRKVIKQTVMTTVYGVTKFGARLQIARQLKEIDDFPQEYVWSASLYLVEKSFHSLRTMFESAREIQDWLNECARVISVYCCKKVEWVTPLGLPVVQPYIQHNNNITTNRDSARLNEKPNVLKQRNAFPPNFVHSLDSTHMMLTGLHCEHNGVTFMSVHDCYWTHACTVKKMNKICRQEFVDLHSQPILKNLSEFLLDKYGCKESDFTDDTLEALTKMKVNYAFTKIPTKGRFELKGVLKSTYFFS